AEIAEVEGGGVEARQTDPGRLGDGGEIDLALQPGRAVADEDADEDREPSEHAPEQHRGQQNRGDGHYGRQGSRSHPVPGGGSEVEPDEGDDGSGDHRRHRDFDPPHTDKMDDESDERQRHAHGDDSALRQGHGMRIEIVAGGRREACDRADRSQQPERRAEVGRHHPLGDEQEEQGPDRCEEQGRRRREAGQQRHEECGAEHRHDMLGAGADRPRPAQTLLGKHLLTGSDHASVSMQPPTSASARQVVWVRSLRFHHCAPCSLFIAIARDSAPSVGRILCPTAVDGECRGGLRDRRIRELARSWNRAGSRTRASAQDSRRLRLRIFPAEFFGSCVTNSTRLGTLKPASRALTCAITSSPVSSPWSGLSTMNAEMASIHFSSATPTTATSATWGSSKTVSSTSRLATSTPPVLMTSLTRSTTSTYPSSSTLTRSPEWNQPLSKASAVASGRFQ